MVRTRIELTSDLPHHPKTRLFARLIGISQTEAVGYLVRLWLWAAEYTPEGIIEDGRGVAAEVVAAAAGWTDGATTFFDAMVSAGFIDAIDAGYELHDWAAHSGRAIERRRRHAERIRQWRGTRAVAVS